MQGALLSLLVVAVPALAAYVATSADPSNVEIGWPRAVGVGASLWLTGHGGMLSAGGATITFIPLGLTALALFTAYASARRSAHPARSAWFAGTAAYLATVVAVAAFTGADGPFGAGPAGVLRTVVGGALVGAVGLGAGMLRRGRLRELTRPWWTRVPPSVRVGAAGGGLVVALLVGAAAVVTGIWVIAGRAAAGDVIEGLGVDTFGGVVLAVAQLAILPNLVLWALAWLVGPGFAVGAGTVYSPAEVVSGPLPALPILGALPPPGSEGGLLVWAPAVVVVAGGLAGWWMHRRLVVTSAWHMPVAVTVLAVAAGLVVGIATALAGGVAGPGRLAVVGGPVLATGGLVIALASTGAAVVALPADAVLRARLADGVRALRARLRGDPDLDLSEDVAPQ